MRHKKLVRQRQALKRQECEICGRLTKYRLCWQCEEAWRTMNALSLELIAEENEC